MAMTAKRFVVFVLILRQRRMRLWRNVRECMQLDHYPAEKLKEQIATIVGWYLDLTKYHVFFFGSRVEGTADTFSDIDVGIDGPEPVPSPLMSAIREGIASLPVRRRIDVVDFQTVGEEFRTIALRYTEPIS